MKKYLTLLLMLMTVSWASAASYQLWIAGIQVTDNNKNNITGYGIESAYSWDGKVSYDPTSKTLTLENICIKSHNDIGIRNEISGVTIWLKGRYNEVQDQWHTSMDGIVSVGNLTFDGEGILKVWGSMGIYIRPNTGDVTIDGDARVEVSGQDHSAIGTDYNSTGSLVVKGRKAMLMATSYSSPHDISGFKDLVLQDGITINRPTGVEYNTSTYCLRDGNSNVGNGTTVVIGKQIAINATNFPNAELRRAVTEEDADNSGYLDRDENYTLERLSLEGNQVDDVTGLNLLWDVKWIEAYQLAVEGITFSNNTLLETINFIGGNLEYLEVDNCLYLQSISAQHHKLSYMDLSSNKHLVNVSLNNNALISFIPPTSMPKDFRSDISLYGNKLNSSKMHTIVNKLMTYDNEPEKHSFNVISSLDGDNEQNQITAEDLAALKTKHWTPYHVCMEKGQRVWKEYEGYKEYDLWVGDNQKVTEANQNDIFGDGGGMMYNPTTKTLSLMNDYNFGTNGIENYIDGLTIKCVDNSTLDCQSDAIDLYANTTITGNHQLTVKSKAGVGIFVDEGKTLTIDNATLEMSAQMPCILGATTTGSQKLNIKDSNIEAHSSSSSVAISGFPAGITFEGCAITEPAGGYVKDGNIVDKDGNWAYDVKIQKASEFYPVYVCGQQLNNLNAADFLGDGTVSYDPETTTLTLNNANFSSEERGIEIREFGYKLNIVGNNRITSVNNNPIYVGYDMRMVGNGSLTVESTNSAAINLFWGGLGIQDGVQLTAIGGTHGIMGYNTPYGNAGEVHVLSKDVVVKATGAQGSIVYLGQLVLKDGTAITQPEGAVFDETSGNICIDGETVTAEVVLAYAGTRTFDFVLQDGTTLLESYSNNLYNAINVLLPGGELVEMYNESTNTTTYCKPSGKKLFTLEPYNEKGDKAYFLADNVEAADAISYDYSDDMESLGNVIWNYPYQDGYDMDGALDFIEAFSAINLGFDIPEVRPTENMVIKVKDGMNGITDFDLQQYAALMAMWKFFGAIQLVPEGENYVYKTNDGKVLCYMSQYTGNVTLAEGVTAADKVYHRILHKDREAIEGVVSTNMTGQSFNFGEILQDVRSITLTVDEGAATGIEDVTRSEERSAQSGNTYNLNGQRVGNSYRGIAVSNGRKVVIK